MDELEQNGKIQIEKLADTINIQINDYKGKIDELENVVTTAVQTVESKINQPKLPAKRVLLLPCSAGYNLLKSHTSASKKFESGIKLNDQLVLEEVYVNTGSFIDLLDSRHRELAQLVKLYENDLPDQLRFGFNREDDSINHQLTVLPKKVRGRAIKVAGLFDLLKEAQQMEKSISFKTAEAYSLLIPTELRSGFVGYAQRIYRDDFIIRKDDNLRVYNLFPMGYDADSLASHVTKLVQEGKDAKTTVDSISVFEDVAETINGYITSHKDSDGHTFHRLEKEGFDYLRDTIVKHNPNILAKKYLEAK